jgi:hypothetical protein
MKYDLACAAAKSVTVTVVDGYGEEKSDGQRGIDGN